MTEHSPAADTAEVAAVPEAAPDPASGSMSEATSGPQSPPMPGRTATRRADRRAVTLLAVLAAASVTTAGVLYATGSARHDRQLAAIRAADAARTESAAAARAAATAVLSYDYRHFDADVTKAMGFLTGSLRSDYETLQRRSVEPTARQVHAAVTATVKGVAVVSATPDTATVLVFVDQLSKNDKIAAPRLDQDRVTMHLTKVGGRWLVSGFDAI